MAARHRARWQARSRGRVRGGVRAASGVRLWSHGVARGIALFFGLFSLLNLVGELRVPGMNENVWWLDLRPLPAQVTALIFAVAGLFLVWWGLRPAAAGWRRFATPVTAAGLAVVAMRNGVTFYHAWEHGQIRPWVPLPLSFVLAAALLYIAWAAARTASPQRPRRSLLLVAGVVVLCGILFPLAQQVFFGKTTYVRAAQVAVVFGAQVHADGQPSICLADRVRTAAQLYKAGLARRLLMSGARGANEPVNEVTVMRTLAIGLGVPAAAIELDPRGYNTDVTVRDTVPLFRAAGDRSVAVVSDFFHLPRVTAGLPALRLRRHHGAVARSSHPPDHPARLARDPGLLGVLPAGRAELMHEP